MLPTLEELQPLTKHIVTFYLLAKFPFTASETELDYHKYKLNVWVNPIQDGPFWGYSRMEGTRKPPASLKFSHMSHNDKTWHSYTLPKKGWKNIWITWHIPWVLLTSAIFHRKPAKFAISRNTDKDSILVNNF